MTYSQMASEAHLLAPADKLALVQFLLRDLQTVFGAPQASPSETSIALRMRIARQLYGALKPASGLTPGNDELRDEYTQYLVEKYEGHS